VTIDSVPKLILPETQPQHKEGFVERFFEHHHHHNKDNHSGDQSKEQDQKPQHQKESEMDKLRDYYHRDEELEEQGQTYGGLM